MKAALSKAIVDADNRLVGVELNSTPVVTYEYDSASRMIQRVEGGTTTNYTWDGWDLIKEVKSGTVNETTNYLVPFGEILAFERGGDWFYLHGDALSSTQLLTDENGDQVGRFIYSAWGEELYASESVPGILESRFVGGLGCRKDAATGQIYMRHRWYDPQLQRFINRDPIGLDGGSNLFQYASTNPVTFTDAWGLEPRCAIVEGSPYTDEKDIVHPVPPISQEYRTIPDTEVYSSASSAEFVHALETHEIFTYYGHHFISNQRIVLSDGRFTLAELFARAKKLPGIVLLSACNTNLSLPKPGKYPGTIFIGISDFVDMGPALRLATRGTEALQTDLPLTNLYKRKPRVIPPLVVVGQPPWKYK